MKIYHYSRCSKSRETLNIIRDHGIKPDIINYLDDTPSKAQLKDLIGKLGIDAHQLVRTGEQIFKEKYKNRELSEDEWIDAMVAHPKLIQRPIVVKGDQAVLGRPPENVLDLLQ